MMMKKMSTWARLGLLALAAAAIPACDDGFNNQFVNIAWFVDPVFGNDGFDGSPSFPFRSMTRALQFAISGDEVILADGSYATGNGEIFPILVKPGVAIIGDTANQGANITVSGAGAYTVQGGTQAAHPATADITATFVLGNGARLTGVKVTATGTGVGIVCDGSSPVISSCTVTGCGATGIRIYQSASPSITGSLITANAAGGVETFDTSVPAFRSCSITSNTGDGVNATDVSTPNLGDAVTVGGNTLTGNTGVGLNNATTSATPTVTVQAVGNTWILSVQGASGTGTYGAGLDTTTTAAAPGNNFAIAANGGIQF